MKRVGGVLDLVRRHEVVWQSAGKSFSIGDAIAKQTKSKSVMIEFILTFEMAL